MIRVFILFYLSEKNTHGYEIQRFLQISGIEQWARIQSGSIYHALNKLEKEQNIEVVREERTGSRIRKIYGITQKGRLTLAAELKDELNYPIFEIGSLKYVINSMLSVLDETTIRLIITGHISELKDKKSYWEKWRDIKISSASSPLMDISFEMTISSIDYQIKWHEELLNNLTEYRKESFDFSNTIKRFEIDSAAAPTSDAQGMSDIEQVERLKQIVESNPALAIEQLNKIISEMKKR